ncbi:MAG: hypothetical protein AB202_01205 [Parcubacteria bacterium C7867-007]|nr:MAG: hypothetical protein AB202_01205 [Parcubacteria bacterium C7867-007]
MQGLTLIETLIYVALFTLMMSTLIPAAAAIQQTATQNNTRAFVVYEGMFLIETLSQAVMDESISAYQLVDSRLLRDGIPISSTQTRMEEFTATHAFDDPPFWTIRFVLNSGGIREEFSQQEYEL